MPMRDRGGVMEKPRVCACPTVPGCHCDIPAPVDRDQRNFDRRARLKRERNARDRQALARRGRGRG